MQYRTYGKKLGFKVSALGMGCMRLPRIVDAATGSAQVDKERAFEMIHYAVEHGVNYFDTAYGYHATLSEAVLGEALETYHCRDKVNIVTKQPFGIMADLATGGGKTILQNARRNLENTLKKLRTSYIDVYLIHNINKPVWNDIKKEKIIEEYEKFRAEGLIRGIGFSYHGQLDCFQDVLSHYAWDMCQIQQNFIDVDREATSEAIHLVGKTGAALVIMEPLRGGLLATPPAAVTALYDEYREKSGAPQRSAVEWAFRHLINYPEVSVILSGTTTLPQLTEDIAIFSKPEAIPGCLSVEEQRTLSRVKDTYESLKAIPCTGCEYCLPCPNGVDIPGIFRRYNDGMMYGAFDPPRRTYMFATRAKQDASYCAACGDCEKKCPQGIAIISTLKAAHEKLKGWVE
ncbi:MAG: aldo/keto reductase [Treponema sp.]|jgi:predicted aldo/keto reductase-like oxidoreductase|nr:aldo/keto reductase [Treponema sp.]